MSIASAFLLLVAPTPGTAQQQPAPGIRLDTYTCTQFLKDAAAPENATSLLKSMMIVAWATGYAAAHRPEAPRADGDAIALVSSLVGSACRKTPDALVVKVASAAIEASVRSK